MRFSAIVLCAAVASLSVACSAPADEEGAAADSASASSETRARTVEASTDAAYALLESTYAVLDAEDRNRVEPLTIRAYQISAADPAMNSSSVYIGVTGSTGEGRDVDAIIDLGVNVASVTSLEVTKGREGAEPGVMKLTAVLYDGDLNTVPYEATVRYAVDFVGNMTVTVDEGEGPRLAEGNIDREAGKFLTSVTALTDTFHEADDYINVRLFERGGAGSATGSRLYLSLSSFVDQVSTFDLGLNVVRVTSVTAKTWQDTNGGHDVLIKGQEEVNGESKPFTYGIDFTSEQTRVKIIKKN